jgi:hypothetical protein
VTSGTRWRSTTRENPAGGESEGRADSECRTGGLIKFVFCSILISAFISNSKWLRAANDETGVALVLLRRSIFGLAATLLFLSSADASAGDYSVTYAIDTDAKNDAGKIESCEYARRCVIKSNSLGLSIDLRFIREDHSWVELEVNGPPGCCYSADAASTIYLEIKPALLRVPIYEGRPRRRNEFVLNKKFGVLYIEFSNLR